MRQEPSSLTVLWLYAIMSPDRTFGQDYMAHSSSVHSSSFVASDGRLRILQAASKLFAQRGYNGVSISDVAEDAHVVKSAIYHHFPSKEALYLAVLQETTRSSHDLMVAGAKGETWLERLRGTALVVGKLVGPRSHVFTLILERLAQTASEITSTDITTLQTLRREFTSVLAEEIAAGIAAGDLKPIDPEVGSLCLIGLIAAALQSTPNSFDESLVNLAVDLFLYGAARRTA